MATLGTMAQWYAACLVCGKCRVRIPLGVTFFVALDLRMRLYTAVLTFLLPYVTSGTERIKVRNFPIPTTHELICEKLKDPGIPTKVIP